MQRSLFVSLSNSYWRYGVSSGIVETQHQMFYNDQCVYNGNMRAFVCVSAALTFHIDSSHFTAVLSVIVCVCTYAIEIHTNEIQQREWEWAKNRKTKCAA